MRPEPHRVFVDTSAYYALTDHGENAHQVAKGIQRRLTRERRMGRMAERHELKRRVPFMLLRMAMTGASQTLGEQEVRRRVQMTLDGLEE